MPSENNNANQILINGEEVINLRSDTVSSENLLQGETAHNKAGEQITGDLDPATKDDAYLVSDIEDDIADDDYIPFNDVSDPDIIKKKTLFSSIVTKIKTAFNSVFASITGNNIAEKKTFRENIQTIEFLGVDIPTNADLNTYTTEGVYQCEMSATARTMSNLPYVGDNRVAFKLIVSKVRNSNNISQTLIHYNNTSIHYRLSDDGGSTWTNWGTIYNITDNTNHAINFKYGSWWSQIKYQINGDKRVRVNHSLDNGVTWNGDQTLAYLDDLSHYADLKAQGDLITSGDLNNYKTAGTYTYGAGNSSNISNVPATGHAGYLFVVETTVGRVRQIVLDRDRNITFSRNYDNSTWTSWEQDSMGEHTYEMGVSIPDSVDLNNYVTEGAYYRQNNVNISTISNIPIQSAGKLLVLKSFGSVFRQIYITYNDDLIFNRFTNDNGSTWSAWTRLATINDISPSTVGDGYAVATVSGNAITATITGFQLRAGAFVALRIDSEITSACTLNINNTGARSVKYGANNDPSFGKCLGGGLTSLFIYDGTYYRLLSFDRTPTITNQNVVADVSGNTVIQWGHESNRAQIKNDISTGKLKWNYYKNSAWRGDVNLADFKDLITQSGTGIPSGSNLDNYTTSGVYYIGSDATAQNISNVPDAHASKLIVLDTIGSANYCVQIYMNYNGTMYIRRYVSGVSPQWTDWKEIATTQDGLFKLYKETTNSADGYARLQAQIKDTENNQSYTADIIRAYKDHQTNNEIYGLNVVMQSGGQMIIGSGEAPQALYSVLTDKTGEILYLLSDNYINLEANASTIANRVGFRLDTSGNLVPIKASVATHGIGFIGTNDYNISCIYAINGLVAKRKDIDLKQANNGGTLSMFPFRIRDKNSYEFNYLESRAQDNGQTVTRWRIKNYDTSGTQKGDKGIDMYMDKSGNLTYWFADAKNANTALGYGFGTCATAEATTAKVVTLSNYEAVANGYVSVKFTYAVPANATMNINSKGAKNIWYRGANITANIIRAGDLATFIYDGTRYHLIGVDRTSTSKTYVIPWNNVAFSDVMTGYYNTTSNYTCAIHLEGRTIIGEIEIALINNPNITVPSYNQTTTNVLCRLKTDIQLFNHFECHVDCNNTIYPAYIQNGTFNNEKYLVIILRKAMPITANGNLRIQFTAYTSL